MAKLRKPKRKSTDAEYYAYMEKLAKTKAKEWKRPEDDTLTEMLNDNTYDYRALLDYNPSGAKKALKRKGHFPDTGKTMYHPTFSNQSVHSGVLSDYNPLGIEGGTWVDDHTYRPSLQQVLQYFNADETMNYMRSEDPKARIASPKYKTGKSSGMIRMPNKKWKYADGKTGLTRELANALYDEMERQGYTGHFIAPHTDDPNHIYDMTQPLDEVVVTANLTPEQRRQRRQLKQVADDDVIIGNAAQRQFEESSAAAMEQALKKDAERQIAGMSSGEILGEASGLAPLSRKVKLIAGDAGLWLMSAPSLEDMANARLAGTYGDFDWDDVAKGSGEAGRGAAEFGSYMLPVVGQAMSANDVLENPELGMLAAGGPLVGKMFGKGALLTKNVVDKANSKFIKPYRLARAIDQDVANGVREIASEQIPEAHVRLNDLTTSANNSVEVYENAFTKKPLRPISKIVNEDGTVNLRRISLLLKHPLLKGLHQEIKSNNVTSGGSSLSKHTSDVVKSAQDLIAKGYNPKGSSPAEFVRAALMHDLGKLSGKSAHGKSGADFLREVREIIPNLKDEITDDVISAVENHMPNETDVQLLHQKDKMSNLIKALRAADIARGADVDMLAAQYPYTMLYEKAGLQPPKLFNGTEQEQIAWFNKWARKNGYPGIPKGYENPRQFVQETMERHNRFYRGARDPLVDNSPHVDDIRNAEGVKKILDDRNLPNTAENRLLASAENIPVYPTGSGRQELFRVYNDGRHAPSEHQPTFTSEAFGISSNAQDALYVSSSPEIMTTYARPSSSHMRPSIAARVLMPFEPIRDDESIIDFVHRADFDMMSAVGAKPAPIDDVYTPRSKNPNQVMSTYQMLDMPYFEQTGRSFSTDFGKWYASKLKQLGSQLRPISEKDIPVVVENIAEGNRIPEKLGSMMRNILSEKDYGRIASIFDRVDPETGNRYVPKNLMAYLSKIEHVSAAKRRHSHYAPGFYKMLSPKQRKFLDRLYDKKVALEEQVDFDWNKYVEKRTGRTRSGKMFDLSKLEKADAKYKETLESMILQQAKKIMSEYADDVFFLADVKKGLKKLPRKLSIPSVNAKLEFMRERGVLPRWEYPDFGDRLVIDVNGGMGVGSLTRNNPGIVHGDPKAYIPGKKGQLVLKVVDKYSEEDVQNLHKRKTSSRRDSGIRYHGEDPKYSVSRKYYKLGKPSFK